MEGGRLAHPVDAGLNQQVEYEIDVEVSLNENDISEDLLKLLLNELSYPFELPIESLNGTLKIYNITLTTVCQSVNNEIRCTCDDQFTWNSTFCRKYHSCSVNITKDQTCDCIKDYPTEGTFCELAPITTTPTQSTAPTIVSSIGTSTIASSTPRTTPTMVSQTTSTTTTPTTGSKTTRTTTTGSKATRRFAIQFTDLNFTKELRDSSSPLYKSLSQNVKTLIENIYKEVRPDAEVNIIGFTNGSVVVLYDVRTNRSLSDADIKSSSKILSEKYILVPGDKIPCSDPDYGTTNYGETAEIPCDGQTGTMRRKCGRNGKYEAELNFCISSAINNILLQVENSTDLEENLPNLLEQLSNTTTTEQNITTPGNVQAVVGILTTFSNLRVNVSETDMENFIKTVSSVIAVASINMWKILTSTTPAENNTSSQFLESVEKFTARVSQENSFNISEDNVQLNAVRIDPQNNRSGINVTFDNFNIADYSNLSANIIIAPENLPKSGSVITIGYPTWIDILPNNTNFGNNFLIHGLVVTIITKESVNVEMTFSPRNDSFDINTATCAFWNFSGAGTWDNTGCDSEIIGEEIKCRCEHVTLFSILMSPATIDDIALDYITKIGVAVSMGSLVITIIIEAIVWKHVTKNTTSYTRHVGILNIAVSLLVADIWFIVASTVKLESDACAAATFFIHFFYLALFFWMLTLGLLLAYRLLFLFHELSKSVMTGISFSIGYLCPLIISVITVGVAYPRNYYIRDDACWLGWKEEYPLLAFIIPALAIIAINIIILMIVIVKLLRPTIGDKPRGHAQEIEKFKQIVRSIAVLTPILGLTWAFGIPTFQEDSHIAFHYIFTILNAFQGFFILIFGTFMDNKVREVLMKKFSLAGLSSQTKTVQSTSTSKPFPKPKYGFFAKKESCDFTRQLHPSDNNKSLSYSTPK
ncbi:adhesion G protein-coupled receptor F4-like [Heptranchias perlo]|uniref:adhesion G protein-coupled receptor F4-like n=1 Tax=Heptranchias perlo TaxID=212740 RepID=UPI00355A54BC